LQAVIDFSDDPSFDSFEDVRQAVNHKDGVLTTTMGALCKLVGNDRPGKLVRAKIAKNLRVLNLGYWPCSDRGDLPNHSHTAVRLYKRDSPVAELIEAALTPSPNNDDLLREAGGGKASDLLLKVRELVLR
jgi:hypothetical protein